MDCPKHILSYLAEEFDRWKGANMPEASDKEAQEVYKGMDKVVLFSELERREKWPLWKKVFFFAQYGWW